ncbi:hypothetical protein [Pseudogulbenkiania sp. MAI-1]|uniref:hypothetical protein n=1 Tax=Pseudogulbenkiania sp. MAI-1 TaxID=990370 RepID=UPI00045EB39C|nr:hypothetical protein [Pseudogulbenkiania sp. MAI-1]
MNWLDDLIARARDGDDIAARALAGLLAVHLEQGEVPPALVAYFAPALKRIAEGRSVNAELNIGTGSKRAKLKRNYAIAWEVWKLHHRADNTLPLKADPGKRSVYSVVGGQYGLSADRIEQIYEEMRWWIEAEEDFMAADREPEMPPEHAAEWQEKKRQDDIDRQRLFIWWTRHLS